jgi:hypothetical protein
MKTANRWRVGSMCLVPMVNRNGLPGAIFFVETDHDWSLDQAGGD